MNKKLVTVIGLLVLNIPVVYLVFLYPTIPNIVPLHFGIDGKPDSFREKTELIRLVAVLSGLNLLIFLLLLNIKNLDPKLKGENEDKTILKIALVLVTVFSALQVYFVYNTTVVDWKVSAHILTLTGVLFTVLGNYMYSIKQNYFVGIKTPWTLQYEDCWKATHRLGGKLWFFGGILIAFFSLALPETWALVVFGTVIAVITIIPIAYSYRYYKRYNQTSK